MPPSPAPSSTPSIRLRGVRHNNLKNLDLDIPLGKLTVITGLSGSGKSSLAFDTLFAEGQRRYIETFSPYARQFFDRMDKPQVDRVDGIPPAIAIDQTNGVRSTRSTVGTMTEICEHMKAAWSLNSIFHCVGCGQPVRKQPPDEIWRDVSQAWAEKHVLITFDLALVASISLEQSLALIERQGYQRLLHEGRVLPISEARATLGDGTRHSICVIQDRVRLTEEQRARFVEGCEQAYHFGKGKLRVAIANAKDAGLFESARRFSRGFHCAQCDIEGTEPSPALFSFNNPVGACPACKGFGRVIGIGYHLAIPDRALTLAGGAVRPWQKGMSAECQSDLIRACKAKGIPTNVPFKDLDPEFQKWVLDGDPDYGSDPEHQWPRVWYGVKGYFRWLESKAYKMHVRVLLSRYRVYSDCPTCQGKRFRPDSLQFKMAWPAHLTRPAGPDSCGPVPDPPDRISLSDFYRLEVREALAVVTHWIEHLTPSPRDPRGFALRAAQARLGYLDQVGLGYLTLDRPTRSLSGGETERVNLTTCLGTKLVNTLFVLDEPTVGLHPRDTHRLLGVIRRLRDAGNTVVVVEHEGEVMKAADQIVDLGPSHGERGGQIVFNGPFDELLESQASLTGQFLSGRLSAAVPRQRPVTTNDAAVHRGSKKRQPSSQKWIRLRGAVKNNLRNVSVNIPLGRLVAVTGVSGSGKTTLVREVLIPAIQNILKSANSPESRSTESETDSPAEEAGGDENLPESNLAGWDSIEGCEQLDQVILVDQSQIGRTPRSNPAVYSGAFEHIRNLFCESPAGLEKGWTPGMYSFNSSRGQCERCRGAGFEKIEMQFLSDVFVRCPDCNGRRYRENVLQVRIQPPAARSQPYPRSSGRSHLELKDAQALPPGSDSRPSGKDSRGEAGGLRTDSDAWSIADVLEATVEDALDYLKRFGDNRHAHRAVVCLQWLADTGLGYLRLGQPINTLSGGECQRVKLASHLAQSDLDREPKRTQESDASSGAARTLFVFDEPTTGLHFEDVRILLQVFQRLVDAGQSVLVVEHHLDVIRSADWIIDLGPEAGREGGELVVAGSPAQVAQSARSHTGKALRELRKGNR